VRVGFGCDHRGFAAKQWVVGTLRQLGHECIDFGTDGRDPVDYPDIAYMVAKAVVETRVERAILVCSTGIGIPMAANKINTDPPFEQLFQQIMIEIIEKALDISIYNIPATYQSFLQISYRLPGAPLGSKAIRGDLPA